MRNAHAAVLGLATLAAACSSNPAPTMAPQPAVAPPAAAQPAAATPTPAAAPAAVDLAGSWSMSVDAGGQMIPVDVTLSRGAAGYSGELVAQGQCNGTLSALTIQGERVTMTFTCPEGDAVFTGAISADRRNVAGDLSYIGQTFPFTMTKR